MQHRALKIAFLISMSTASVALAQRWQELGPALLTNVGDNEGETSRVSALAVSPRRADRYFVGGAFGGVWRSTDAGATWSPRTDRLPTLTIGALALDPNDDNIVYAGTGDPNNRHDSLYGLGLYKSVNGGNTWRVLAAETFSGRAIAQLAVSAQDSDSVWAAVTPAGSTFRFTAPPVPVGDRKHPRRNGPLGIFRSADGGDSWTQVRDGLPDTPATAVVLDPRMDSRIYVAFGSIFGAPGNGIYRSTDGGASFSLVLAPESPTGVGRVDLAVAPSNPDRLYALISEAGGSASQTLGLFRSADGGDSWTRLQVGNVHNGIGAGASALAIHPADPDTLFVGSNALLRSQDGGSSFTDIQISTAGGRRLMNALAIDGAGRLLVGTDAGLFQSSNLGDNWTAINRGLRMARFHVGLATHASDPNLLIGGTTSGLGRRDSDSLTWRRVIRAQSAFATIDPRNPDSIVVQVAAGNTVFRFNNGTSIQLSDQGIPNERASLFAPLARDPQDPDRMLFATYRIYESTDNGSSWRAISDDLTNGLRAGVRALAIAPSNSNMVYATTTDNRLLTSTDGGRNWQLRTSTDVGERLATRQIAVDPRDDARAYVAISRFGGQSLLATTNRGATWVDIGGGLPNVPVNAVAVYRRGAARFIFAGTDRGAWLSSDDGATWAEYGRLPFAGVQDLVVDTDHDRLLATTAGRGAWSTVLPTTPGGGPGPTTCQEPLGSGRFCSACGPCAQGEGDCDSDNECQAGLSCAQNVGADFGFAPAIDVCIGEGPQSCAVGLGNGRFCSACGPCGVGQGDCDSDAECGSGLRCAQNVGADFGFAPAVDVCVAGGPQSCSVPAGNGRFCTECGPCGAGQGDCDSDAECRGGLTCAQNVGADFGFPPAVDVCVAGSP